MRLPVVVLLAFCLPLTGCGLLSIADKTATQVTPTTAATTISGNVHGGNQPIVGATIQLWEASLNGYGATPTQLGSSVTTVAGGNFSITGQYNCSNGNNGGNPYVYLTATGGNPGFSDPTTNNTGSVLMAALGPCGNLTSNTFVIMNEVTTVAAVTALRPFMNSSGGIGTTAGNVQGLANAFLTANLLVNLATGTARTSLPNSTAAVFPVANLNTLANILTPCVNSATSSDPNCTSLFSATTQTGITPTNTLVAAFSIAVHPTSNITTLFGFSTTNPAFQPALATAPNDFTLSIGYTDGPAPTSIAVDSLGNLWTVSPSAITEMNPSGAAAGNSPYADANLSGAYGLALATNGLAYVTNSTSNTVTQYNLSGANTIQPIGSPFNNIGLSSPKGVMVDSSNYLWIANSGSSSVTQFNLNTSAVIQYSGGGLSAPVSIAGDLTGDIWVTNSTGSSVTSLPQYGNGPAGYTSHTGGGISTPAGLAIDASGDVWVTDAVNSEIAELSNSGVPITGGSGYNGGGLTNSYATAIDGNGHVFSADYSNNSISELTSAGAALSGTAGFVGATLSAPKSIAVDLSGNVWVGNSAPINGVSITEFIAAGAPANAPLQAGLINGGVGQRPGVLTTNGGFQSNAELGQAYADTFTAAGGTGSYTWSITSGLSALQAAGFTFTTTGTLSGTPISTGTFPFTVQVSSPGYGNVSRSYTLTVTTPPATSCTHDGSGNSILNGHYAFLLSGFDPNGHHYDQLGSFTANGSGAVSNGVSDVNGDRNLSAFNSGSLSYNFTGTYSIGSTDNRGQLTLTNSNGTGTGGLPTTTTYCFAADTITSGVAYSGRIIQADGSGYVLTGFFNIQNPSYFSNAALNAGYVLGVQGVTGASTTRAALAGQFTTNGAGSITSGQFDTSSTTGSPGSYVNTSTSANPLVASSSSYSMGANGRGTITVSFNGLTIPFIAYLTGTGQQILLMSQNAGQNGNPLFIGKALLQTTTSFTTANVAGPGVFRAEGVANTNTTTPGDADEVGQLTLDGAGNGTFLADGDAAGSTSTTQLSGTYTVSSIGYLTLAGGSNPPRFYLFAPGGGFGVDNNVGVGFYYMLPQTIPSGGFTNANIASGSYAFGTVFPLTYNISSTLLNDGNQYPFIFDGAANFSSGSYTFIQDTVAAPGTPASSYIATGQTQTGSYYLDPTYGQSSGRFFIANSGQNSVTGYIISSSQVFALSTGGGNPQLVEGDHK